MRSSRQPGPMNSRRCPSISWQLLQHAKVHLPLALELIEKGLVKNSHNIKARGLKAAILRKLGKNRRSKTVDCRELKSRSI